MNGAKPVHRAEYGDLRVTVLEAGSLRLDGGAMFGVVPKPLWERQRPCDDRNRIELAMNVVLVEDGERTVLIDTGAGTDWDDKSRDIYALETMSADRLLAPVDLSPEDVDVVVCSHLHFDHAGGNTTVDAAGTRVAAFSNAEYVVQKAEMELARVPNERVRASYRLGDFEPLFSEPGRVRVVDGVYRPHPHIELHPAPGHTPGMQIALVEAGERSIAFLADLVPTASHVPYPYIMGYDLEPLRTLESKKRFLPRALEERWLLVFEHDRRMPLAELDRDERGRLRASAAESE